jgi:hypothetical protein
VPVRRTFAFDVAMTDTHQPLRVIVADRTPVLIEVERDSPLAAQRFLQMLFINEMRQGQIVRACDWHEHPTLIGTRFKDAGLRRTDKSLPSCSTTALRSSAFNSRAPGQEISFEL